MRRDVRLVALRALVVALLALRCTHRPPRKKTGAAPKPTAERPGETTASRREDGQKSKQYTFGGLDIDGKLKTPQLLYFLNRMKSEFDTTTPDKRSFIPELKRSTDEM